VAVSCSQGVKAEGLLADWSSYVGDIGHWRSESATHVAFSGSIYAEQALVWFPFSTDGAEGLRLRSSTAYGVWREVSACGCERLQPKVEQTFTVGHRWRGERTTTTVDLGLHAVVAIGQTGIEERLGPTATVKHVWSPTDDLFLAATARASAAHRSASVTLVGGWTTPFGFKLGPEVGVSFGRDLPASRIGLALTGFRLFEREFAVTGGIARDERGRVGPYVGLWIAHAF
jgi:hypothetical protein